MIEQEKPVEMVSSGLKANYNILAVKFRVHGMGNFPVAAEVGGMVDASCPAAVRGRCGIRVFRRPNHSK